MIRPFSIDVHAHLGDFMRGAQRAVTTDTNYGSDAVQSEIFQNAGGGLSVLQGIEPRGSKDRSATIEDAGDGPACDHADWAEAETALQDGSTLRLDQMKEGVADLA